MVQSTLLVAAMGAALPVAFATPSYPVANGTVTYTSLAPSGTGSSKPAAQTVHVGENGLKFTPDSVTAKVGEQIVFEFFPKNHGVVQADFQTPCVPKNGGINSGFIPSTAGRANKTFTITVKDDKPVWLYCPQNNPMPHCAAGMVAVINPPTSGPNTLDAFRAAAAKTNSTGSVVPSGAPSGGDFGTPGAPGAPGSGSGAGGSGSGPNGSSPSPSSVANSVVFSGVLTAVAFTAALFL